MYHEMFQQSVEHEFNSGRYEGPFSQQQIESILGPFQTSPISIIPKPNKPGKFHIIQNFSSPYSNINGFRSINADILSSDFPCTWGTFEAICTTVHHLPPESQAAVQDIAEAYRTIPIKPSQWPGTVVHILQSKFAIDKCVAFGCSFSASVFGNLADAAADIFRSEGIGPVSKWVDDFIFFCVPKSQIPRYNQLRHDHKNIIALNGNAQREGRRLWFKGAEWPDGSSEEFNDSCQHPIKILLDNSHTPNTDTMFPYSLKHIDTISEKLEIPWERSKDHPFTSFFTYLGFLWDIDNKLISLTNQKRAKYIQAINN